MNFPKTCLIVILLLAFGAGAKGQEPPKAKLFDEFPPDCEVLWARLDGLMNQLQGEAKHSFVTVELSGKKGESHVNYYWESMIRGYFVRRNIPQERWSVRRTALGNDRIVRFWLTAAGDPPPKIEVAEWPFVYSPGIKPFIFTNGESYSVEVGVCLDVDELALLAMALNANPDAKVHVVLVVRSELEYQRRKRVTIKKLVNEYEIVPSRIRTFKKINTKPNPYGIEPNTEYWFVP